MAMETQAVNDLHDRVDGSFVIACETLLACEGRVIVTGMGKSGHIGNKIAALAVVADIKIDNSTLITIKLKNMEEAFFPNLRINHNANLLATPVATNILAKINDKIFNHITS